MQGRVTDAENRLDEIIQKDPMRLRWMESRTKKSKVDKTVHRRIYILMVFIPVLSACSAFFYVMAMI
jgi:hypothetical protein